MGKWMSACLVLVVLCEVAAFWLGHGSWALIVLFAAVELGIAFVYIAKKWDSQEPVIVAVRSELTMLTVVARLFMRKRAVPAGATPITACRGWWHLPAAMTAATGVECLVIELAIPWQPARVILLMVSFYSLILLWGYMGSRWTHPHFVGEALFLRHRGEVIAVLPRLSHVRVSRGHEAEQCAVVGHTLILGGEGTNVELSCPSTARVQVGSLPWKAKRSLEIRQVRIGVDAPDRVSELLTTLVHRD